MQILWSSSRAQPPAVNLTSPCVSQREFNGEIVSCDSVAIYRGMEIGTAKPSIADRALVPHHLIDVVDPDQPFTAGDYSRLAREALLGITSRGRLPIVAGGTGLYLRALVDGLFPAPAIAPVLRARLRRSARVRGAPYLHRLLRRLDASSAAAIHPNDEPKIVRALEITLTTRSPVSEQWKRGRDPLTGFRLLRLGLAPARDQLYHRINTRARAMFDGGLVEETALLEARFGRDCRSFGSLGYAEAGAVLRGEITRDTAVAQAQQGHRNYAKRQGTWFRRDPGMHWLVGLGGDPDVLDRARRLVSAHLLNP